MSFMAAKVMMKFMLAHMIKPLVGAVTIPFLLVIKHMLKPTVAQAMMHYMVVEMMMY